MYDYSEQIEAFRDEKVRLPSDLKDKLYERREANRKRLISRLPEQIEAISISDGSFKPQGSMAVDTIIQTKFKYEEYDIDDGLVLLRDELKDKDGNELTAAQVREEVLKALKDNRFVKPPQLVSNAVRVFYKEEDAERHHIDFPVYRKWTDGAGVVRRELAGENGWIESDPTEVNEWFLNLVKDRNAAQPGRGTQCRRLIQLLKRFSRSRNNWDLPNGMKLSMLVAECQPAFCERLDLAMRKLFENLKRRLATNRVIRNLAHPEQPELTRTISDGNVEELQSRTKEALDQLRDLDKNESNNRNAARKAWEWIFQSDGFFSEYDRDLAEEEKAKEAKEKATAALLEKARLINTGAAQTSAAGVIGLSGVQNRPHHFYGEDSPN